MLRKPLHNASNNVRGYLQFSLLLLIEFKWINPLSTNPTKWPNTLKQFVSNLPTNCLSVFDHSMKLSLKGLRENSPFIKSSICSFIENSKTNLTWNKILHLKWAPTINKTIIRRTRESLLLGQSLLASNVNSVRKILEAHLEPC